MKIRNGFVSNSSSSSFIINKKNLTDEQINKIKNHIQEALKIPDCNDNFGYVGQEDEWDVEETEKDLIVTTGQDDFCMKSWLRYIKVCEEDISDDVSSEWT